MSGSSRFAERLVDYVQTTLDCPRRAHQTLCKFRARISLQLSNRQFLEVPDTKENEVLTYETRSNLVEHDPGHRGEARAWKYPCRLFEKNASVAHRCW